MNAKNSSPDIREKVVGLSRELGFDICRFAKAEIPEHAAEFRDWLDRGDAGEMNYLARNSERRCDPLQILPDAKTVIVLALNYFQCAHKTGPVEADVSPAGVASKKIAAGTGVTTAIGR